MNPIVKFFLRIYSFWLLWTYFEATLQHDYSLSPDCQGTEKLTEFKENSSLLS